MHLLSSICKAILPDVGYNKLALLKRGVCNHCEELQWQHLKQRLSTRSQHERRRKRWQALLASGRPIRVAFQVAQLGKWKCESVLQLMQNDSRFTPFIWCVPVGGSLHQGNPAAHATEVERIVSHFTGRGIRVCTYASIKDFPEAEKPDVIFIHEAYDYIFKSESYRGLTEELLCYVPYGFHVSAHEYSLTALGKLMSLFCFVENEVIKKDIQNAAQCHGLNACISGHPMADIFEAAKRSEKSAWKDCGKGMKKVIWAPHWTIYPEICWFASGTFLKNAEAMLELAERYADSIQFAFKPHPHLHRTLCGHPAWGKEKTDAYFRRWVEMPNTQLEEGGYTELFMQSDGMIHDCGSFTLEYLYADKPCLFLKEGDGYPNYNQVVKKAQEAYHHGLTGHDIDTFLQHCILNGEDPKAATRREVLDTLLLPPGGLSAAENIVKALTDN